jgi:hypothetical protein
VIFALVALLMGGGAAVAAADQPPLEFAGQPFYFSATCTGIGDVILVNQSLSRNAAYHVLDSNTTVVGNLFGLNARGVENNANGTCTFIGGGFSPETIEPLDEPITIPVLIL